MMKNVYRHDITTIFIHFIIVFSILHYNVSQYQCPCDDPSSITLEYNNYHSKRNISSPLPLSLCLNISLLKNTYYSSIIHQVISSSSSLESHKEDFEIKLLPLFNSTYFTQDYFKDHCNAIIVLYDLNNTNSEWIHSQRIFCPGQCSPIPTRSIPIQYIFHRSELYSQDYHGKHHQQPYHRHGNQHNHNQNHHQNHNHNSDNIAITCSFTRSMLLESTLFIEKVVQKRSILLHHRLKVLFWRILMECFEKKHWYQRYYSSFDVSFDRSFESNYLIPRRKVESMVIWIGTTHRLHLVHSQFITLFGQSIDGEHAVVGWAALDDVFDCASEAATKCIMLSRRGRRFIPRSTINQYNIGWRCAQRRPLRALAHILTLFDPIFLVIGDDDTLINYPLLINNYHDLIYEDMFTSPIVLGEFTGAEGDTGHLSRKGFYGGGSGYVLGKKLLNTLVNKEIKYWEEADYTNDNNNINNRKDYNDLIKVTGDSCRSRQQIMELSMVAEGLTKTKYCEIEETRRQCIQLHPFSKSIHQDTKWFHSDNSLENVTTMMMMIPIASRLIDFCVNLLANDNTCLHSDHSMTRCFLYGAYANALGSTCHSLVRHPPRNVSLGMCFMTPYCNLTEQTTCHRYMPRLVSTATTTTQSKLFSYEAVRISNDRDYYKVYSSMFDGNKSDTYM